MIQKKMFNFRIYKLSSIYTVLVGTLIFNILPVSAYLSDIGSSKENKFSTGTLSFSLNTPPGFSTVVTPTASTSRDLSIKNTGTLDFKYKLKAENIVGDLCPALNITAWKGGSLAYENTLQDFASGTNAFDESVGEDVLWDFEVGLNSSEASYQEKVCNFDLVYSGWQTNLEEGVGGFTHLATTSATITSGTWLRQIPPGNDLPPTERSVVLNEIYPSPISKEENPTPPLDREWVELYNNSSDTVDVLGWKISELAGENETEEFYTVSADCSSPTPSKIVPSNGGSTIVSPNGFLVLEFCSQVSKLNNSGDSVALYNPNDLLIDVHTYPQTDPGKSHQRIPDGIGPWVDPIPTPGEPNSADEIKNGGSGKTGEETDEKIEEKIEGEIVDGAFTEEPEVEDVIEEVKESEEPEEEPKQEEIIDEKKEESVEPKEEIIEQKDEADAKEEIKDETEITEQTKEEEEVKEEPIPEPEPVVEPAPEPAPITSSDE